MESFARVDILGCPFDAISYDETVASIRRAVLEQERRQLCPGSVDFVMKARRNPAFAQILHAADCVFADGVPIVWAASLLGTPLKGRVCGTDIVWSCAEISADIGCPVAMIGGAFDLTARAAERLRERFPKAVLHPLLTPFPLGPRENADLVERIRDLHAAIILVALGAPRQERWIRENLVASGANVGIGIGSAFDIISGDKPQAPQWMRDHGLEWSHRMRLEPKRLGRRYLIEDSPFLLLLAVEVLKRRLGLRRPRVRSGA